MPYVNSERILFPPTDYTSHVDVVSFSALFDQQFGSLKKRLFKFERRQTYKEPDNPAYQAFLRDDMKAVESQLKERITSDPLYAMAREKGIRIVRVHFVEAPISDYLKFEFKAYGISSSMGEDVRIVPASLNSDLKWVYGLLDFLLFDGFSVMVQDYDDDGLFKGAWFIDKADVVKSYSTIADQLIALSAPLDEFRRRIDDIPAD